MTALPRAHSGFSFTLSWVLSLGLGALLVITSLFFVQRSLLTPASNPQPLPTEWLSEQSIHAVDLRPGMAERLLGIRANPLQQTLLSLQASAPTFAFAAQVRDDQGTMVAQFDSHLQVAALALSPRQGSYTVRLSALDPMAVGQVQVAIGSAAASQGSIPGAILSKAAPPCHVTANSSTPALLRSAPRDDYEVLGTLAPPQFLTALGRADDQWVAVNYNERMAWLNGALASLEGDCDSLGRIHNPVIPDAPLDQDVFLLEVDRDAGGELLNTISTPQGDLSDLIWLRVINLYTSPPNNYREFTLTLTCSGIGTEHLRWGSPYAPTLRCGESLVMPFLYQINQQPVLISFEAASPQSYLDYRLSAISGLPTLPMLDDAVG